MIFDYPTNPNLKDTKEPLRNKHKDEDMESESSVDFQSMISKQEQKDQVEEIY